MNWNPFAKLGSAKQRMLTSSEQREFEKKKDDMIHFEKTSKKLYHDVKKLGDSLNALNRCEYQLARDFQLSLGKASGSGANVDDKFVESWLRSCEKTDRLTTDLNRSLNTEVSEPMKNFNVVFQNWRSALKRWETSLQDCARFHQKLEKLQEKGADPSPQNVAKMNETKRSLDASREEFSHLHSKLMEEMDLLKQKRLDYFDPTVDSLIAQQLRYFKEMERSYGEFVRRTSVVDLSKSFEGDSIEQKLNEIRVGMAWDFRKEEDVKKYLENLNIEYKFGCYQEKKPNVCHLLGDFYEAVKQEFTAAYDVYKTNCETNKFAPSCNKYATYLIRGKECEKDWDKAGELMIQSCNEGFQPSCYFAGLFSLNGTSRIPKNVQLGLESLDKCCIAGGNADCCFALASVYLKGSEDVQKDMLKAAKYSQACCDLRLPQGCANLSRMYRLGDGVEKNEVKAAEYSKLAKEIIEELRNPIDLGLTG